MRSFAPFYENTQLSSYLKTTKKKRVCHVSANDLVLRVKPWGVGSFFGKSIFSGKCFVFLSFLKSTSCGSPLRGGGEKKRGVVWEDTEAKRSGGEDKEGHMVKLTCVMGFQRQFEAHGGNHRGLRSQRGFSSAANTCMSVFACVCECLSGQ